MANRVRRGAGVVTTAIDSGIALHDLIEKPTLGNWVKFGVKATLFGLETVEATNPYIGLGIAILDATGATKWIYDKIDKKHPCLGCAGPKDAPFIPKSGRMSL